MDRHLTRGIPMNTVEESVKEIMDLEKEIGELNAEIAKHTDAVHALMEETSYLRDVIDHMRRDALDAANSLECAIDMMNFDTEDCLDKHKQIVKSGEIEMLNSALKKIFRVLEMRDDLEE